MVKFRLEHAISLSYLIGHMSGRENEPLDVEMLPELLQTVARADRVLSSPAGRSLLLIGRSGVGRHTTIKLLSVMHHARIMTPYPGKNYGRKQFTSDLKSVRKFFQRKYQTPKPHCIVNRRCTLLVLMVTWSTLWSRITT